MDPRDIDRLNRHRDEGVYVPPIEKDKQEKEKYTRLPPERQKKILIATLFSYLKKIFDSFSPSKKIAGKIVDVQGTIKCLQLFSKSLEKLTKRDFSRDSDYAIELSERWIALNDNFENIQILQRKELTKTADFRNLLDTIKHYPPNAEHHLGYYLLQHAGKDWLPFPFIEILEALHNNHIENPESSTLTQWLKTIEVVIEQLSQSFSPQDFSS